jgi:hypothetical protein
LTDATFEQQVLEPEAGMLVESTQVASLVAVRPLARLTVGPGDLPFLHQTRRHDPAGLMRRVRANVGGFPWVDE